MDDDFLDEIKVILLGDSGVGKTNIISRYSKDEFKDAQTSTNGSNYIMKNIEINGKKYLANIWDTAGQEKYRAITKMFLQDTHILILCYSIIDHKSFESLEFWYNLATDILGKNIIIGVAGNKSDLYEEEKVTDEEAKEYAYNNNIHCFITSARNNVGINNMFEELGNLYLEPTFQEKRNQEMKERNEDNGKKNNIVIIQKDLKNNDNTEENNKNKEISNQKKKKNCC